MSCHMHCATPIYSAVLIILHDLFCTFWGRNVLPSEIVYHVSYAQEPTNTYITGPITFGHCGSWRKGGGSPAGEAVPGKGRGPAERDGWEDKSQKGKKTARMDMQVSDKTLFYLTFLCI